MFLLFYVIFNKNQETLKENFIKNKQIFCPHSFSVTENTETHNFVSLS
jgi:hypothetical protein